MLTDAFDEMLMAILSFISTACDSACLHLSDRLIARADQRMVEQLIDDDVCRARARVTR